MGNRFEGLVFYFPKGKTPNDKSQKTNKFQYSMTKIETRFRQSISGLAFYLSKGKAPNDKSQKTNPPAGGQVNFNFSMFNGSNNKVF